MNDDFITATNEHEREMTRMRMQEEESRRAHRTERIIAWAWAFGTAAVVAIIAGSILFVWQRSSAQDHEEKLSCTAAGGTWTSIGGGTGVCVSVKTVEP